MPSSDTTQRFLSVATTPNAGPAEGEIALGTLKRYWRDPARDALLRGHGISLQALDSVGWPDREPLETRIDRIERVDQRLLFETLAAGCRSLPTEPPAWLAHSGMLAGGAIGAETYLQQRESLQSLLDHAHGLFAGGIAQAAAQAVDLDLGDGLHLAGVVDRVFHGAEGRLLLFDAKPARAAGLKEMLAFYIDWAALRLTHTEMVDATFLEHPSNIKAARTPKLLDAILMQDTDQLRRGLRCLIETYLVAAQQPLLFFPQTALAYAVNAPEDRLAKAAAAWEGDDFNRTGERDYAPGYTALLSRGLKLFDADSPAHDAFVASTELICGVLDPARMMLLKPPATEPAAHAGENA